MIPVGYMAKRLCKKSKILKALHVTEVYSVSGCISEDFADYIPYWKHNSYWLFDSPEIIKSVAGENAISIQETTLFFYEAYEKEFDGERWDLWSPESSFPTNVVPPTSKQFEGFDAVTFDNGTNPGHSPLSCNGVAEDVRTNSRCLFDTFEEAEKSLDDRVFKTAEPGPYRIFAVYSLEWP